MSREIANQNTSLTLGIPADREVSWTLQILSKLNKPDDQVGVIISRWVEKPLTLQELELLNRYFPAEQVPSPARHAPAMRNAIVNRAQTSHILFLDDDMVPDPGLLNSALFLAGREPYTVHQGTPFLVANSDN